jgi:general secretion pathway protein M
MTTSATARPGPSPQAAPSRLAPVRAWWATLARREQTLTLLAATFVGLALLWLVALRPAWTTVRQAPAQLDALEAQLQAMQRLAAEAQELRATPSIPPAQAAAALQASSARLGERAKLSLQGDRAVLSVTAIDSESLRNWLAEVRSGARARPVEAQLARTAQGFTGTVTLTLVGTP